MTKKQLLQYTAIALIAGLIGGSLGTKLQEINTVGTSTSKQIVQERHFVEESDSIKAIEKVAPAVLSIVATKDLQIFQQSPLDPFGFFGPFGFAPQQEEQQEPRIERQQVAGGTGFIINADGLGVTNKHVVADPDADYTAVTTDEKIFDVEVISRDPVNDLAIIQLHEKDGERKPGEKKVFGERAKNLPFAQLGDSSELKVGQKVFAIGNARGEYVNSVTAGIISGIGREISAGDTRGIFRETLTDLIQTDAAINFGNSGGPLINLGGEVIGVNTAIDQGATGIGFAIPASQVNPAIESVKKFGKIVRPLLGVSHVILNKKNAKELKIDSVDYGALIIGDRSKKDFGVIQGGPAEKAGLKIDDIILEVDGVKISEENTLQSVVQNHAPGETLTLKVWRDGRTFDVKVKLDERKE